MAALSSARIDRATVAAYMVPTEEPESDGTLTWDATTLVLVQIESNGKTGLGYTYADGATARLINDKLLPLLVTHDAMAINVRWHDMVVAMRNLGRPGIASMAIAAVDTALWDLKAKLLDLPLAALLGLARPAVEVYGSGGFTNYSEEQLKRQLHDWAQAGMRHVKMKVGRDPAGDIERVYAARDAIGNMAELFVDANGAYTRKQALEFAATSPTAASPGSRSRCGGRPGRIAPAARPRPARHGDRGRRIRLRPALFPPHAGGAGGRCAAGRRHPLRRHHRFSRRRRACAKPSMSRCRAHCAPTLHLPLCCAARPVVHLEYFHDHARIEHLLFDGAPLPQNGRLAPDMSRPGFGIEFKEADAQCYKI